MKKKRFGIKVILVLFLLGLTAAGTYVFSVWKNLPPVTSDVALFDAASEDGRLLIYADAEGEAETLAEYEPVEYADISFREGKRQTVSSEEIPNLVREIFLASEDRKFYRHHGFDPARTAYAAVCSAFHIGKKFGASTVTQQVVKNMSGDNEVTVRRKLSEIFRAVRLEDLRSKDEILTTYLNLIPLTDGMSGVGIGAERYFGKTPAELTPAQIATLAGITNAPRAHDPYAHPQACLEKRNRVLYAAKDTGVLTEEEYQEAITSPLGVLPKKESCGTKLSWFSECVIAEAIADLSSAYRITESEARTLLESGGYSIYSTVSPTAQAALEAAFSDENLPDLAAGTKYAAVLCDARCGDLRAILGGGGKKRASFLFSDALTPHAPGSSLKPLALYAPLLDEGVITPKTEMDDAPISLEGERPYPKNSPDRYDGYIPIKEAIAQSKNTVAVRLYRLLGAEKIYRNLKENYGFDTLVRNESGITDLAPSPLALGQLTRGVTLRRLTEAYTVFTDGGNVHASRSYLALKDRTGKILLEKSQDSRRVLHRETARQMREMLRGVTDHGTARSLRVAKVLSVGGKTGTSGDDRDRLFVGFTVRYTLGIWSGRADGAPLGTQQKNHLEIWDDAMQRIYGIRV